METEGGLYDSGFTYTGESFLLRLVSAKECMVRNSLTLGEVADFTAKAAAAQQWSLESLDQVVLDNYTVPDYLLAKQGGICAIANTTCCTWINISGEVEIQLNKIRKQALWSLQISPNDPWSFDLFN